MAIEFPEINLIGYRVSLKKISQNQQKRITLYSIYALVGFLVVFVPVLLLRLTFSSQKSRLTEDISLLTQEIEALKSVEAKYVLLNVKSQALIGLSGERIVLEPRIVEVYDVMPAGTLIDDVSFGDGGDFLQVTVKAQDVFAVGNLMESLSNSVGKRFSKINIQSTKRDSTGLYKVAMELYFEV